MKILAILVSLSLSLSAVAADSPLSDGCDLTPEQSEQMKADLGQQMQDYLSDNLPQWAETANMKKDISGAYSVLENSLQVEISKWDLENGVLEFSAGVAYGGSPDALYILTVARTNDAGDWAIVPEMAQVEVSQAAGKVVYSYPKVTREISVKTMDYSEYGAPGLVVCMVQASSLEVGYSPLNLSPIDSVAKGLLQLDALTKTSGYFNIDVQLALEGELLQFD